MKTFLLILAVVALVATALVGACAAICGCKRIDAFCSRHLTDTDGQPEQPSTINF